MAGFGTMTSSASARPLPADLRNQRLRQHPFENEGELGSHLLLLIGGEDIDDTVDGLRAGIGVQGGKTEMTGFGDGQRRLDGFQIAQLADQDDIGILAQDRFEAA